MSEIDASCELSRITFMWRELNLYSAQEEDEDFSLLANVLNDLINLICGTVTQVSFSSKFSAL